MQVCWYFGLALILCNLYDCSTRDPSFLSAQDAERERSENVDRAIAERCLKERMRARVEGMQKRYVKYTSLCFQSWFFHLCNIFAFLFSKIACIHTRPHSRAYRWLIWLAFLHRTDSFVSRLRTTHAARLQREREEAAIQVLVRAFRRFHERRRRRRLQAALVSARLMLRVCAHNYTCVQSDRSADVIVAFMGQMTGTRSLTVIIANFRKKTLKAQALIRGYLSVRAAKLATWQRQWVAAERHILADEYAAADAALDESEVEAMEMARVEQSQAQAARTPLVVPLSARVALLSAKMDEMQRASIRSLTDYRHAMIDYERMRDFAEVCEVTHFMSVRGFAAQISSDCPFCTD